jgi:hypothetical protein
MGYLPNNTQEKSLLLEQMMSLKTTYGYGGYCLVYQNGELIGGSTVYWYEDEAPHVDLYDEHNMGLAWRAIIFANTMLDEAAQDAFNRWWCEQWQTQQLQLVNSPTDAQQKWLDKVLELRLADETMSTAELSLAFN